MPRSRMARAPPKSNKWDVDLEALERKLLAMGPSPPGNRTDFDELFELYMAAHCSSALKISRADDDNSAMLEFDEWKFFWQHMYTARDQELLNHQEGSGNRGPRGQKIKPLHNHKKFMMSDEMCQLSWDYCFTRKNKWFQKNSVRRGGIQMTLVIGFGSKLQNDWRKLSASLGRLLKKAAFQDIIKREDEIVYEGDDAKESETETETEPETDATDADDDATEAPHVESAEDIELRLREEYDSRMDAQREEAEASYQSQLEEIENSKNALAQEMQTRTDELEMKCKEEQANAEAMKEEMSSLKETVASSSEEIANLKAQLDEAVQKLGEKTVECDETHVVMIEGLNREKEELKEQHDQEVQDLKARLDAAEKAGGDSASLAADLEECRQTTSDLTTRKEELENEKDSLTQEMATITEDMNRIKEECDKQQAQLSTLNSELVEKSQVYENEIAELKSKLEAAEQAGGDVSKLGEDLAACRSHTTDLEAQLERLREENERITSNLSSVQTQFEEKVTECENHTSELEASKEEIERLKNQLAAAEKAGGDAAQTASLVSELQSERTDLLARIEQLVQENASLQTEVVDKTNEISTLTETVGNLTGQVESKDNQINELQQQVENFEEELNRLRKELAESESKIQQYEEKLSQSEVTIEELRSELANKVAQCEEEHVSRDEFETLRSEKEKEIEDLRRQLESAQSAGGDASVLSSQLSQAQTELDDLRKELERLRQENNVLTEKNQEQLTEIENLTENIQAQEGTISDLRKEIERIRQELETKIAECDSQHVDKVDLEQSQREVGTLQEKVESLEKALRDESEKQEILVKENEDIKKRFEELQTQYAEQVRECEEKHVARDKLEETTEVRKVQGETDQWLNDGAGAENSENDPLLKETHQKNIRVERVTNNYNFNAVEKQETSHCCGLLCFGWGCSCCQIIEGPCCGKGVECCNDDDNSTK